MQPGGENSSGEAGQVNDDVIFDLPCDESPAGFEGGDANLYRYVGNMPTMYADPSGLVGDGHHYVNQANWTGLSSAVKEVFDSEVADTR